MLSNDEGMFLVKVAREAITTFLKEEKIMSVPVDTPDTLKVMVNLEVVLVTRSLLNHLLKQL
jgi:AMMECR1 domain-containing protein